jgi:preprotein translocase subunit SecG
MEDEVKEFQKTERSANFLSRITAAQIVVFIIIVLIILAISKNQTDSRYMWVLVAGLLIIIAVLYFKPSKKRQIIPEPMAKKLAYRALQRKKQEGIEISFDSKVNVMPQTQLIWKDDLVSGDTVCTGRDIGFEELVHGSSYRKEGVINLDAYTGEVNGICWMPLGYSGRERTTNVKIIPVGVVNTIQGDKSMRDMKPQ